MTRIHVGFIGHQKIWRDGGENLREDMAGLLRFSQGMLSAIYTGIHHLHLPL